MPRRVWEENIRIGLKEIGITGIELLGFTNHGISIENCETSYT